jgi:DNA repair protein RecO (recombination protein O)
MKTVEQGILIQRAPYSETSLLVTLLCKTQGLSTFLFQGGKKKKGNMLFPMAHVEFTYYKRNDSTLGKISEVSLATLSRTIPFDPVKSGIAFFMAELIHQVIRPGHSENQLYQMLENEVRWLDESDELTNYPIWFLGVLSRECGIVPSVETAHPTVLDYAGKLTTVRPLNGDYTEGKWMHWMEAALLEEKHLFLSMTIPKEERLLCLDAWLRYFKSHLSGIRDIKSVAVIREVMS